MAWRFASLGARWCTHTKHLGAVAVAGISVSSHGHITKTETGPDASNLAPHHLSTWQTSTRGLPGETKQNKEVNPMAKKWPQMNFLNPDELVMGHIIRNDSKAATRRIETKNGCVRANAARQVFWNPADVKVGIVTCGGLCPGLNSIIREVTNVLVHDYGVQDITGFTGGYNGLSDPENFTPIKLDTNVVREIHLQGGSILKAGRGGMDPEKICDNLQKMGVNMLFVVGGDGTQSAGDKIYAEAKKRNFPISIVGVPKSIDNDTLFIHKRLAILQMDGGAEEDEENQEYEECEEASDEGEEDEEDCVEEGALDAEAGDDGEARRQKAQAKAQPEVTEQDAKCWQALRQKAQAKAQAEVKRQEAREAEDLRREKERKDHQTKLSLSGFQPYFPKSFARREKEGSELVSALVVLHRRYKEDAKGLATCLQTLRTYINNLARNPHEAKFQRINCENSAFKNRVGAFEGAAAVLQACGFEDKGGCLVVAEGFLKSKGTRLSDAVDKLDVLIDQLSR